MRASIILLVAAMVAIPSMAYSQDSGLVDGRVGSELDSSPASPAQRPSAGHPYGSPLQGGPIAGRSGNINAGQVVPKVSCLFSLWVKARHGSIRTQIVLKCLTVAFSST